LFQIRTRNGWIKLELLDKQAISLSILSVVNVHTILPEWSKL